MGEEVTCPLPSSSADFRRLIGQSLRNKPKGQHSWSLLCSCQFRILYLKAPHLRRMTFYARRPSKTQKLPDKVQDSEYLTGSAHGKPAQPELPNYQISPLGLPKAPAIHWCLSLFLSFAVFKLALPGCGLSPGVRHLQMRLKFVARNFATDTLPTFVPAPAVWLKRKEK